MTDYDHLYSEFQLKTDDAERINNLYRFAKACHENTELIVVTTTVTDSTGTKILKTEVQDAKLV